MNVQAAAAHTALLLKGYTAERDSDGMGLAHALWMLEGIADGYIQRKQAHRWLGYAQAVIVNKEVATLEDVKGVNKTS